jgi:enolase
MPVPTIVRITGREILSSGGNPTIEARVELSNGIRATASVPYGESSGAHEAFMLLDHDKKRYRGNGMKKAARNISTTLNTLLRGTQITKLRAIDDMMIAKDGTKNKSRLGGNAILAVSIACARAGAHATHTPLYSYLRKVYRLPYTSYILPKPMMVTIEGGRHADRSTDFQEYLLTAVANKKRSELIRMTLESYMAVRDILKLKGYSTNVGNEGAFTPPLKSNEAPLAILVAGIKKAGYRPGKDVAISLDPAASEVYKKGMYILPLDKKKYTATQMIGLFAMWLKKYPIVTLEDPLSEDDWTNWAKLFSKLRKKVMIVGDDLTVTNVERLKRAIKEKVMNVILIKPNQIGSVTETIDTLVMAHAHHIQSIISHRGGGETADSFIIDLGVAVNAAYYKIGPTRGERTEKYNRLLEIEEEI